MIYLIY